MTFPAVAAYQVFLTKLFARLNAGRRERYLWTSAVAAASGAAARFLATGTGASQSGQPGDAHRNIYSVHSRLIGEMVEARVGPDTVEIWYADRKVEELPRFTRP